MNKKTINKPEPAMKFKKMVLTMQEVETKEKISIMALFGSVWLSNEKEKVEKIDFIMNLNEKSNKVLSAQLSKLYSQAISAKIESKRDKEVKE